MWRELDDGIEREISDGGGGGEKERGKKRVQSY